MSRGGREADREGILLDWKEVRGQELSWGRVCRKEKKNKVVRYKEETITFFSSFVFRTLCRSRRKELIPLLFRKDDGSDRSKQNETKPSIGIPPGPGNFLLKSKTNSCKLRPPERESFNLMTVHNSIRGNHISTSP
jgi:hypothetical protein